MFRFNSFVAAPALVLLMGGTAHAALTADQVWQSWKDGAGLAGLAVTAATEANSGGVLTLNGVNIGPAGAPVSFAISDMTLTEESDGTVSIRPGASMGIDHAEGARVTKIGITHDDLTIIAREEAGALIYDFSAAAMDVDYNVAYEGYAMDGSTPAPIVSNTGKISMGDMAGSYSDTPGTNRAFGLDIAAASFIYDTLTDNPGLKMKNASHSETVDFVMGFDMTMPSTIPLAMMQSPADFRTALNEGMSFSAVFSQGGNTGSASAEDQFFPYDLTLSSEPSEGTFALNKDQFFVESSGAGLQAEMTSAMFPAPVSFSLEDMVTNITLPVMATTAADMLFQMKLGQLTLSDGVWGMFDPTAALKREPFDLNIDISGKTTMDLIGMMEAGESGTKPPIPAPESLDITDISLTVAGAVLKATGAFTFDNSMGIPAPLGEANISVSGANALIDGLISIGIITEDDAMGARMMMGMFMAPGTEPDSLTTKIEAKEGFAIFVNGQQVQ